MQLPVLNLPLSAIGQLDLHVQLSLTHHQVQIHTSFHRFMEIGQVKKIQHKCSINTRKKTFQVAGVSISTEGRQNVSATLLIVVGYFFPRKKKQLV